MKANHLGFEFAKHLGGFRIKRRPTRSRGNGVRIDPKLPVIGCERLSPGCLALNIGDRLIMAEEVNVERPVSLRCYSSQLGAHNINAQHGAWERAKSTRVR